MKILTNNETGIAVKLETDSLGAVTLTHISFEPNAPEEVEDTHTIQVKKFTGALAWDRALGYAKLCVADVIPAGTFMRVG
jgi:hypothetical protein